MRISDFTSSVRLAEPCLNIIVCILFYGGCQEEIEFRNQLSALHPAYLSQLPSMALLYTFPRTGN
jgi:hypothetical protein